MSKMSKLFSFVAGLLSGSVVGATAALLLAPESGEQLKADARARWQQVLTEAELARERTRREMELQFERMKESGKF
ncbi:MAG TPA: YtxH domain-containing protein [Candidatus Binatia bacterium]|jgi:gas vesicle protein|nr:YtxH domain-containing protein [Candidatus Binatia bacterium]